MYNTFLISYDPSMTDPTPNRLVEFIRSNGYTFQYMIPFLGSAFVKSNASLTQMNSSYSPFLTPNHFVISQIFPIMTSGLLPPSQWSWINADTPPPLPELR